MGLLNPLSWPLLPVQGVVALAEIIRQQAQDRQVDPVQVRRELEEIDRARQAGEITGAQAREWQQAVLSRLVPGQGRLQVHG